MVWLSNYCGAVCSYKIEGSVAMTAKQCEEDDDVCSLDSDSELRKYIEQELLTCRYCQAPLKAVPLDVDDETGKQHFFWTCRNVKAMTCHFPVGLPNQAYWLTRTAEQRQLGFFPRPAVHKLPQEYRSLYPLYFSQEARKSSSMSRSPGTSANIGSFVCPASTHSPCTSTSSTLSENTTLEHLNDIGLKNPASSVWERAATKLREASLNLSDRKRPLNSGVADSSSASTEVDTTTYASSEFSDGDLVDVICDQLEEMGVDVRMIEEEDLIREMSSAVKTLKSSTGVRRLRLLIAHDRITTEYLFNLDVAPIKRRLNVISSDLTRAVAVMRSDCDVDTLLDVMRGGSVNEPSAKRLKSEEVKAETKRRVEALLKKLAEQRRVANEVQGTPAEVNSAESDPDGAKQWFDGEDGPSTLAPTEMSENATENLDEEARLNAIVQSKVRLHIEKAAARRHALKSKKLHVSSQQTEQPIQRRAEAHTHTHAGSPLNVDIFDDDDALLSFDSPYMEESFADDSTLDFTSKETTMTDALPHLDKDALSPYRDTHIATVDPSNLHTNDNIDLDLFDGYNFLF